MPAVNYENIQLWEGKRELYSFHWLAIMASSPMPLVLYDLDEVAGVRTGGAGTSPSSSSSRRPGTSPLFGRSSDKIRPPSHPGSSLGDNTIFVLTLDAPAPLQSLKCCASSNIVASNCGLDCVASATPAGYPSEAIPRRISSPTRRLVS